MSRGSFGGVYKGKLDLQKVVFFAFFFPPENLVVGGRFLGVKKKSSAEDRETKKYGKAAKV